MSIDGAEKQEIRRAICNQLAGRGYCYLVVEAAERLGVATASDTVALRRVEECF